MADQIEIALPVTVMPEGTSFTATAYYRTRSTQAASTPTTVHYRVDCLSTKTALQGWTAVASPSTSNSISITSTMNAIQDASNTAERRQLTVKADDGLSTQAIGHITWQVENLYGSP